MKIMNRAGILLILASLLNATAIMAYESAYPMAEPKTIEVIKLPAARLLQAKMNGSYFEQSNNMFRQLFNYIKTNDIAMTVPVEGQLENASMRFYLGSDAPELLSDTDEVNVIEFPERQVLRVGGKGSYAESNINKATAELYTWLNQQSEWEADGEAYAVFWNGPFTLWFMKRFEIHLPVRNANSHLLSSVPAPGE